jgi:ABC-type dipeptide/oligopeptide/nickel transport system permease subunit
MKNFRSKLDAFFMNLTILFVEHPLMMATYTLCVIVGTSFFVTILLSSILK